MNENNKEVENTEHGRQASAADETLLSAVTGQKQYYILCLRHTKRKDKIMTLWGPDRSGYQYNIERAGLYTAEECDDYYPFHENRDDIAIEKELAESLLTEIIYCEEKIFKVILNNQKTRLALGISRRELLDRQSGHDTYTVQYPKQFIKSWKMKKALALIDELKTAGYCT